MNYKNSISNGGICQGYLPRPRRVKRSGRDHFVDVNKMIGKRVEIVMRFFLGGMGGRLLTLFEVIKVIGGFEVA